jgi:DNA mismatch repair protein MutH
MLNNLSEQIRDCYRHAQDCARKAAEETDSNLKQDFLELEELAVLSAQFQIQRTAGRLFRLRSAEELRICAEPRVIRVGCSQAQD